MINKKISLGICAVMLCGAVVLTNCKKKEKDPEPVEQPADESGQSGIDNREAQAENDAAVNEINEVLGNDKKIGGKQPAGTQGLVGAKGGPCGLTVDASSDSLGVLVLNYNGTTCNNRTRTGSIKVTLQNYASGKRWSDQGAVLNVEYLNFKIERASDKKSMTFNGVQQLTNVSGGNWLTLFLLQQPLVLTVTGSNLAVKFHDNKTATYNINRKATYTFSLSTSVLTLKAEGIGSSGNLTGLENFGTTRDGDAFTSQVLTPFVWNTTCGGNAPLQGEANIKVTGKNFDLKYTYGVDANGNVVTVGANTCPFGWKLEWTAGSTTKNKVVKYF